MGIRDDQDFQVVILDTVEPIENGWLVGYNGWMLFCPNENCTVPPQVHETMRMFGKGLGFQVRGIEIGGRVYRYKPKVQADAEHAAWCAANDRKNAVETAEMLLREEAVAASGEKYAWRVGMGEISGFGGGYEEACRIMLRAGLHWLDDNTGADPQFHGFNGVSGVIVGDNADAKELSNVICKSVEDCTGAMHQAVVSACLYIRKNGWDSYCTAMSRNSAKGGA